MPGVVLHCRLPQREQVRRKSRPETMGAERAEPDRRGGSERAEDEKNLQAGFLVLFLARCGRFLP
jgi:hypothetical protein